MEKAKIDGNSVREVRAAVGLAADRARAGEGPTLIEAMTYRHKGHSRTDPAKYRPKGELERWLERDPILLHESALAADGVPAEDLDEIRATAERSVREALERARSWDEPAPADRFEHVYA